MTHSLWAVCIVFASLAAGNAFTQPAFAGPLDLLQCARRDACADQALASFPKTEAGTIVIETKKKKLVHYQTDGSVKVYDVGVGRPGFQWRGTHRISRKEKWPSWSPPAEMIKRQPYLPRWMAGGPGNPLGARALYLGDTLYRIHGTSDASSVGQEISSGCFRMRNEDIIELYERVGIGTAVVVR